MLSSRHTPVDEAVLFLVAAPSKSLGHEPTDLGVAFSAETNNKLQAENPLILDETRISSMDVRVLFLKKTCLFALIKSTSCGK